MFAEESCGNRGSALGSGVARGSREGGTAAGSKRVTDGPVRLKRPGNAGGGKGPEFKIRAKRTRDRSSLRPPEGIKKLQDALHAKAKGNPNHRFYTQYDKLHGTDVLGPAYRCGRGHGGKAGVDGESGEEIEAYGLGRWLGKLAEELRTRTDRRGTSRETAAMVTELNRTRRGWGNCFSPGPVSKASRAVDMHTRDRLRQWLRKNHKVAGKATLLG